MSSASRRFAAAILIGATLCSSAPCFASARDYLGPAGAFSGAIVGAKWGASLGAFAGPAGAGVGAFVGGFMGALTGDGAGRIMDWSMSD